MPGLQSTLESHMASFLVPELLLKSVMPRSTALLEPILKSIMPGLVVWVLPPLSRSELLRVFLRLATLSLGVWFCLGPLWLLL